MEAEARALGAWREDPRIAVHVTAGRPDAADRAVAELEAAGVRGLISWGVCGGLDPALRPGDLVICAPAEVAPAEAAMTTPAEKAAAWAAGRRIVDMESGAVARSSVPQRAVRVVLDEAGVPLPPPALVPLRADGTPDLPQIARALIRRPSSLPAMIGLARRHAGAMRRLRGAAGEIGKFLEQLSA